MEPWLTAAFDHAASGSARNIRERQNAAATPLGSSLLTSAATMSGILSDVKNVYYVQVRALCAVGPFQN